MQGTYQNATVVVESHSEHDTEHRGAQEMSTISDEAKGIVYYVIVFFSYLLCLFMWPFCIRVISEYERGIIFRLGRLQGAKGPGLFFLLPCVDSMVSVDLRTKTLDVPKQEVITKDSVTVYVNAVVYFKVDHPVYAICNVQDHVRATYLLAQTTLRSVLGQSELDEILSHRDQINGRLKEILDTETDSWGIHISAVEVKDIQLPVEMQRAMASQAEAERERRAKVISADGEFQASARLTEAARVMSQEENTMQLRYLQTLTEIATERQSTILFPLPMNLMNTFTSKKHE